MVKHRLLIANYDFPPAPSIGGTRWVAMKKYLRRLDYDALVLTTSAFGRVPDEADDILRTRDLVSSQALRRLLRRPSLPTPGEQPAADKIPPTILTKVVVPDVYAVTWIPFAARVVRQLVRDGKIDVVVTTSPKDSTHLAGLVSVSSPVAWVADFRDGWTYQSTHPPFPTRAQRALNGKLEALVVQRADAVVAATDELAADFCRRLGVDAVHVGNAWDPDLAIVSTGEGAYDVERRAPVRIVYTGLFTGSEGAPTDRSPLGLL
jgi:hypothetical protein